MAQQEKVLELKNVSKRFAGAVALDRVDFELYAGSVHGLVGENGAGKSTLMKIISGVHTEYDGDMLLRGERVRFRSPKDALSHGIGMIYQELSVIPNLTVAENIFLGNPVRTAQGVIDWKRMFREADDHLRSLGLIMDVRRSLRDYTVATQQMVEIARVIFSGANIIIMDEPTSALSHAETQRLFGLIQTLKNQGKSIVYISHFLEDVLTVSDQVTILRNARRVMQDDAKALTKEQLTAAVLGKEMGTAAGGLLQTYRRKERTDGTVLELRNLTLGTKLTDVSLSAARGEILGIYGAMGSGKDELAECLFGIVRPDSGSICLDGQEVHITTTSKAARLGIAYVPPNRQDTLFPINEIYKNITIAHLREICARLVRRPQEVETSQRQMNTLGVYPPNPTMGVGNLSGGNQQKVVLAKWLTVLPKVLMLNDPTRGMDVGAKKEVMDIIENLRDKSVATLLLSQEPELLMAYADRVIVLHRGHQVAELQNEELTKEGLLAYS